MSVNRTESTMDGRGKEISWNRWVTSIFQSHPLSHEPTNPLAAPLPCPIPLVASLNKESLHIHIVAAEQLHPRCSVKQRHVCNECIL